MNTSPKKILTLGASLLTLTPLAIAQTTGTPVKTEETVQLSEFTVKENSDTGYIASETATGPRLATKIADLPYPISIVTSKFMEDFGVFDFSSSVNGLAAGVTGASDEGSVTIRGTATNNNFILRNGFYRLGMVDRVNTDRMEFIKGPNAAIYGAANPTGVVNIVGKKPKFGVTSERVIYSVGPFDYNRVEGNFNQSLGSVGGVAVANLISVEGSTERTPASSPAGKQTRTMDDTVSAKFKDGSQLTAEFEWVRINVTPGFGSGIPFEGAKGAITPVQRRDLAYFNQVGDVGAIKDRSSYSAYLTYEKRFSPAWSSHIDGYWYRRPELQVDAAGNSLMFDPATQTFSARSLQWDMLNQDGGGVRVDTVATYPLFEGRWNSKTLFTLDYSQNWRMRQVKDYNTGIYPASAPISVVKPVYFLPTFDAFNITNRNDKTRADAKGAFISEQLRTADNRWINFLSLRRDLVTYNLDFANQFALTKGVVGVKTPGQVIHYESSAWSPSLGTNYKLTKTLAAYASYSRSFAPQLQVSKLGTPPLPNEIARGWDYGFKGSFLDDHLAFTLGGYYIDREGIKTTVKDPVTGLSDTVAGGSTNTKGVEVEGSWRVNESLTFVANYGYANSKITNNGSTLTDVGQEPAGTPVDLGGFFTTYRISSGPLHGLSLHLRVGYTGRAYPFSTQTTFQRGIIAPSYFTLDPGLTYELRSTNGLRQSFRLSARNVLDRNYVTSDYSLGARRGVYFSYSLAH